MSGYQRAPLPEDIRELLTCWLRCWFAPRVASDMVTPVGASWLGSAWIEGGVILEREPVDRTGASVELLSRAGTLCWREPADAEPSAWLIRVGDLAPARARLVSGALSEELHIDLSEFLLESPTFRARLGRLLWVLGLIAPELVIHADPPELATRRSDDDLDGLRELVERACVTTRADGACLSPASRAQADAVAVCLLRLEQIAVERGLGWGELLEDSLVSARQVAACTGADGLVSRRAPGWVESEGLGFPSGPLRTPERETAEQLHFARLADPSGAVRVAQAPLAELLAWFDAQALSGVWSAGTISVVPPEWAGTDPVTVLGLPYGDTATFIGEAAASALVSQRLLRHGPWRATRVGRGWLIRCCSAQGPTGAAASQRTLAAQWGAGLLVPPSPTLPASIAEYDPDTRMVLVHPRYLPDLSAALAHVVGWSRGGLAAGRPPVERVLAPIADPVLARLWLPHLWLREIQVWTVEDGDWTRIDEGYEPTWAPPDWLGWDSGAGNAGADSETALKG